MRQVQPQPLLSHRAQTLVLGLLLAVAALAVYNPVAHHPFVNFDDDRYVTDNFHVRAGLHWETIRWAFTSFDEANWHPLTWLSHALDCQVFGLNPAGHHYINVLLHAGNAFLLFWLLWQATGAIYRSGFVAALFALHPINVESVAWVAERKTSLSMLFLLLALAAYQKYVQKPSTQRYLGVTALFACGLMAKPMVITLPFVLLLWDYWPLHRIPPEQLNLGNHALAIRKLILEKIPWFLMSAASAWVTMKAQGSGDAIRSSVEFPLPVRLENAAVAYLRYLSKAFWPASLAPIYPHTGHALRLSHAAAATVLLIAITALFAFAKQQRYLIVGWLWFLGTLVPMIGLVQVGVLAMADRYAYLPFIGLFLVISWGVADLAAKLKVNRWCVVAAGTACLLALASVTRHQIKFWDDNVTLWSHAIEVTPPNFTAEDNLGGALMEQGRLDVAMIHFRRAAEIEPTDLMSRLNLAADDQRRGNIPAAIAQFTKITEATNDRRLQATAFTDLGHAYRSIGDLATAQQDFEAAVHLRPQAFRAWVGLGLIAQQSGHFLEAAEDYSNALASQPWDLAYVLLARALQQAGKTQESQAAMQEAERLSTNFNQLQQVADRLLQK
jgi:protein O-mannosyl-transferase